MVVVFPPAALVLAVFFDRVWFPSYRNHFVEYRTQGTFFETVASGHVISLSKRKVLVFVLFLYRASFRAAFGPRRDSTSDNFSEF
jgi:hypothetical protein